MGMTSPPSREERTIHATRPFIVFQRKPEPEISIPEYRMMLVYYSCIEGFGWRAGQCMGLIETPLKIQDEESRVKIVLGSGGRIKASGPAAAAVSEDRPSPFMTGIRVR